MTTRQCVHRFRLAPQEPMRKEYPGVCLYCGVTKVFPGDSEMQVFLSIRNQPFGRNKPRPVSLIDDIGELRSIDDWTMT